MLLESLLKYSIDTSALIHAWQFPYPPERFPSFWREMENLINVGILAATDEVKQELSVQQDELYKWAQNNAGMFVPKTLEIQKEASKVIGRFPGLVKVSSTKPDADPFVIALAVVGKCAVVTQEKGGSPKKPKIPYVCAQLGVCCIDLFDFVGEQNWSF